MGTVVTQGHLYHHKQWNRWVNYLKFSTSLMYLKVWQILLVLCGLLLFCMILCSCASVVSQPFLPFWHPSMSLGYFGHGDALHNNYAVHYHAQNTGNGILEAQSYFSWGSMPLEPLEACMTTPLLKPPFFS